MSTIEHLTNSLLLRNMRKTFIPFLLLICFLASCIDSFAQEANTNDDELKILSWNIYMLPRFVKHTGKRKRAREIAKKLKESDYDIFVFQEAFHGDARRILKRALKKSHPYMIGPANRKPWWVRTSSGVWIVSNIPLKELEAHEYNPCHGFVNCMARKGVLMVEGEWNGQVFQLLGTHIQAGGPDSVKLAQYTEMKEVADRYRKENVPQIMAGDYNMCATCASYKPMLEILDVPDYQPDGERKYSAASDNDIRGSSKDKLIDFIFYKANGVMPAYLERNVVKTVERWSKKYEDLSDHYAIEAIIRF